MNFAQMYQQETTSAAYGLMANREKMPVASIVNREVTLCDCALMDGEKGMYAVLLLAEYPDNFICGGSVVTNKLMKTADAYGGWPEMVKNLKADCPTVIFRANRSRRTGNTYTDMEVLVK